jgi:hypothetical protein
LAGSFILVEGDAPKNRSPPFPADFCSGGRRTTRQGKVLRTNDTAYSALTRADERLAKQIHDLRTGNAGESVTDGLDPEIYLGNTLIFGITDKETVVITIVDGVADIDFVPAELHTTDFI